MLPMNQTVEWLARTGDDDYGQPLYSAPLVIPCRAEPRMKIIRSPQGEEVISSLVVFTHALVSNLDAIRYDGRTYPVIISAAEPDLSGRVRYREVSL